MLCVGFGIGHVLAVGLSEYFMPSVTGGGPQKFSPMTALAIISLIILIMGMVCALGGIIGAMLWPTVPASRAYRILPLALGLIIAAQTYAAVFFTEVVFLDPIVFGVTFLGGFISAFVARWIGLGFDWARPWYPAGRCQACGYDLLYTPKDSTCPECGVPVSSP